METTLKSPTSNEKKSLTSGKNTSHRGNDAQCPTFPSRQTVVQAKLELTTPGDSYEQEADRMADHVMRSAFSVSDDAGQKPQQTMSRPIVSRRSSGSGGVAVDSQTESGIMSSRGGGSSLPTALRSRMESGFGADFSNVRIHNDASSAFLSNAIQAKAFTYGNDIYFNRGQYSPSSSDGQRLIAHELTHTLQQTGRIGRDIGGEQEDQEIKDFKEMSFDLIVDYHTGNPNLQKIVEFARIIWRIKPNSKFSISYDINSSSIDSYDFLMGKHFLFYFDKYLTTSGKGYSYTMSDVVNFLEYADDVYNSVEDKKYVHGRMQQKSYDNFTNERRKDGKGITIAIITDQDLDYNSGFRGVRYLDAEKKGLYEKDDYFYVLQGLDSFDDYIKYIKKLVEKYGPLQNLILSGHGNWDIMGLGKGLLLKFSSIDVSIDRYIHQSIYKNIQDIKEQQANAFKFFNGINDIMVESRKELGNNKQSIFLESCLTDVPKFVGYDNYAQSIQKILGNDVKLYAAEVSINRDNYQIDYDNTDNSLNVTWDYGNKEEERLFLKFIELGNEWYKIDNNIDSLFGFIDKIYTTKKAIGSNTTKKAIGSKKNHYYTSYLSYIIRLIERYKYSDNRHKTKFDRYFSINRSSLPIFKLIIRQMFYNIELFVDDKMNKEDILYQSIKEAIIIYHYENINYSSPYIEYLFKNMCSPDIEEYPEINISDYMIGDLPAPLLRMLIQP